MFKRAIVRTPGKSVVNGLTSAELSLPNYENALVQHAEYINALEKCGLAVIVLGCDEEYPDKRLCDFHEARSTVTKGRDR